MTSAALIILPKNEFVKAGSFYSNERIGLDYNFIYGAIKDLSEIINNSQYGVYFDIYFGREFATKGELEALNKIRDWIDENTDNLTSTITIEPIGNDSIQGCHEHIMKLVNNKLELMGYGLEFREGSSGPPDVVIPNNESFVFLNRTISGNLEENNITTDEYVKIVWPPLGGENGSTENPLNINYSEYGLNITIYNMSYNRLGTTDSIIFGETTYIEDYSKSSTEEKIDKIHIINVTDENYNNTVESLYDSNASGFILIRDNVSEIKNWSIDVAGVAVSSENGSLLINLTENGTIFTFPTEEEVPLDTGMLQIYHRNDTCINNEKRIYLVNTSWFEDPGPHIIPNWYQLIIFNNIAFKERCKGIILINSLYPQTHLMYPYSKLIRWSKHLSYSRFRSPMFSINGSVIVNGEMKDFMSWVKEQNGTNNPVKANYWILQRKNDSVESYNIYCDVIGEDTTKWIYMSGAHYEAWRGQSTSDNAVGVAQMLGILKYLNDNHITPKCNLRFMFHGGHENLLRGAYSHVFNPENEDVLKHANLMLALDQLGHHFPATFRINASDESMIPLLWAIFDDFDYNETYQETKGYDVRVGGKHAPENGTIEAKIYNRNYRKDFHYVDLDYIEFCKDSLQTYHQTGDNHTRGDTLDIVDRDDVNVTVDMIWSVAKYFTVNPDCWIDSYSATAFDSDDDNDTLKDSINVSFSLKTILPNDIVHVKAELKKTFSINEIVDNCIVDYVINLTYGVQDSIILTVPENVSADFTPLDSICTTLLGELMTWLILVYLVQGIMIQDWIVFI